MYEQLAQHLRSSKPKGHKPTPRGTWGNFEESKRWGGEKVACWRTKATISLKGVKLEEKLLWIEDLYRKSPTLFPKIGDSQPPPKTSIANIPGMGKATDFKFGQYIHMAHPNKRPLKSLE